MRHRTTERAGASRLGERVRAFFFAEEVPYGLAFVRILLPLVLFVDMVRRWPFVRELYSADGATAPLWFTYGLRSPLPELPGAAAVALFTLLLVALVATSAGWMTRVSSAIAAALYFYFTTLDSVATITKYTVIASHVLLLLALSNCGAVLSLDALRRPVAGPRFPVWPRRLVQILIGVVYFGAAMTKIHTPAYFNGDQMMFWMLTHVNGQHPLGETLANYPAALAAGAYAAVVWEIMFIFLAWRGVGRLAMLAAGVAFHVSTYLTLGLDIFPCVMIATYFAFMGERDAYACGRRLSRLAEAVGFPLRSALASAAARLAPARKLGPAAFVMTTWALALGGAAAERVMDPYNERGPGGPMPLTELDPDLARKMLAGPEPLRPHDKIFSFEIGTGLFGDVLVGRRRVFEKGDDLIAQCVAAPPHGDAYVECNLHTADGRLVERAGRVLMRESTRVNFTFPICDAVPPGDYELVLKLSGTEITRKPFTVAGDDAPAAAA
ncbi:MAG TPA: HTTM domain-containing protein, partial [Planctomycetaceae bacterium]